MGIRLQLEFEGRSPSPVTVPHPWVPGGLPKMGNDPGMLQCEDPGVPGRPVETPRGEGAAGAVLEPQ